MSTITYATTTEVTSALLKAHSTLEHHTIDLSYARRGASLSNPGKRSVSNTIGTAVTNLLQQNKFVSIDTLREALANSNERTLAEWGNTALRDLCSENGGRAKQFRLRGNSKHGALIPTKALIHQIYLNIENIVQREIAFSGTTNGNITNAVNQLRSIKKLATKLGYNTDELTL